MKGPSLQRSAALSAGLHVTFFLLSFLVLRQSNSVVMPSPYVVSLVSPGRTASRVNVAPPAESAGAREEAPGPAVTEKKEMKAQPDEKAAEKLIDESISEIQAKKRIQRLARLRALVNVQGKGGPKKTTSTTHSSTSGRAGSTGEAGYIDKITAQIQGNWAVPDFFMNKNLEAIISVRIGKDGTLYVERFEKKSGDRFYDKYVMDTIRKSSPVIPPPKEMEIGIRFSSNEGREG